MKLEKNTALLMPPPGEGGVGFIPDAVRGHKGDLVWGQAYDFVEVKGRKEMSWQGNLPAMIQYVEDYGGSIEVVFRSAKHPDGATKLSERLRQRIGDRPQAETEFRVPEARRGARASAPRRVGHAPGGPT